MLRFSGDDEPVQCCGTDEKLFGRIGQKSVGPNRECGHDWFVERDPVRALSFGFGPAEGDFGDSFAIGFRGLNVA